MHQRIMSRMLFFSAFKVSFPSAAPAVAAPRKRYWTGSSSFPSRALSTVLKKAEPA